MSADAKHELAAGHDAWEQLRKLRGLMQLAPAMPLSTAAGCIAVVLTLGSATPRPLLATWFDAGVVLAGVQLFFWSTLHGRRASAAARQTRTCRLWLVAISLATGAFWGATSLLLSAPDSPWNNAALALILAAVTAVWLPLLAIERAAFVSLAALALLPMAFTFLSSPLAGPPASMGSLFLLLFVALLLTAHVARRMLEADGAAQRELYHRATHDSLVDLLNRSEFHRAIARLESGPSCPYAVVLIDLDHFKAVNDSAGHSAGDRLLRHVGAILREEKRKTDIAARIGGDEFAILMQLCSDHEAMRVATAVLRRVGELGLTCGGRRLDVSASIGIACSATDHASTQSVLEAADRACYAAKRAGRNRIERAAPAGVRAAAA